MTRLLPFLLILLLFLVEASAWHQFQLGEQTADQHLAWWTHGFVALTVAVIGSFTLRKASWQTRCTLAAFFFILAVVLPLAGVLLVLALGWILSTPAGTGERPEDRYVFGNPAATAARRESRHGPPELLPLTEAMRAFSAPELEKMIHGLRHLQPARLTRHFLQRFQIDPASHLQFAAQGIITGHLEQLEIQLKTITARLASNPCGIDSQLAAAEILLELADWTPAGDATAQVYQADAERHLQAVLAQQPRHQHALRLQVRALFGLEDLTAAKSACAQLAASEPSTILAKMEADLRSGNYPTLPTLAALALPGSADTAEMLGFWTGRIEAPAALRPKAS